MRLINSVNTPELNSYRSTTVSELKFEKFHVLAPSHQEIQKCLKMIIFDLMGNHGVKMWRFTNFNSETLLDP